MFAQKQERKRILVTESLKTKKKNGRSDKKLNRKIKTVNRTVF
jgi:hypothetical protein